VKKVLLLLLYRLYAVKRDSLRRFIRRSVIRLEGGQYVSKTLRRLFKDYHRVEIGLYTYGCFHPECIAPFTKIGRYCSISPGVQIFGQNHPINHKSTHPYFYMSIFGYVGKESVPINRLTIGNDVWIGGNAIILPSVKTIGDGAVIGAGAVVTKDVPDFAVMVGNPARVIKYRFSQDRIYQIKQEQWWNKDIEELQANLSDFIKDLED
jgi:virginiamycin A acetyltransferase